jgi:hypothetical protein
VGGAATGGVHMASANLLAEFLLTKPTALGLVIFVAIGAAASSAQESMDCSAAYKSSLEKLKQKDLPPARLAALSRQALRIYDACKTDDMRHAETLFESLDRAKD